MNTNDNPVQHSTTQPGGCSTPDSGTTTGPQDQIVTQEAQLRAKSELIDNMIYQIRTLSNAIIGFSDLLSTEPLSEDQGEYVQEIHHAGQGLSILVNDVLDWTQLLSAKLQITKTKFYISDILKDIERTLSWAAKEKGLKYQIVTDPDMPACVCSDRDRLLKCLNNLTACAIKHAPQGNIQFRIQLSPDSDQTLIRFDIMMLGDEIDTEKLNHIFDPSTCQIEMDEESFSQLSKGIAVTAGVPLTKLLCEKLGGSIEVRTEAGSGTIFSLCLPTGVNSETEPKLGVVSWDREEPEEQSEPEPPSQNTVLLVEDQLSNRTVISLMLEALGVQVDTANDGEQAIAKVDTNTYDLILMDIKMPNMDGYEATRQLRQNGIPTPIIALSAKVLDENEHRQMAEMFDGFLAKPVDSRKLSETLKQFIECFTEPQTDSLQKETAVFEYEN